MCMRVLSTEIFKTILKQLIASDFVKQQSQNTRISKYKQVDCIAWNGKSSIYMNTTHYKYPESL